MLEFSLTGLLDRIGEQPGFRSLLVDLSNLDAGESVGPLGLPESARAPVVAALIRGLRTPVLCVTAQPDDARSLADQLGAYLPEKERVHLVPAPDALPFERLPWDPSTRELRLGALAALHRGRTAVAAGPAPVLVAPLRAVLMRTMSAEEFSSDSGALAIGDRVGLTELLRRLERMGYEPVSTVHSPGQMAHRGGIVDVFCPGEESPVRLEWFGDEIDSLRRFDPVTQRSESEIEEMLLVPASEALPGRGPEATSQLDHLDYGRLHPLAETELRRQRESLSAGERFSGMEFYGHLLHPGGANLVDHLPPEGWLVLDSPDRLGVTAQGLHGQARTIFKEQVESGELPSEWPVDPLATWAEAQASAARHRQLVLGRAAADTESHDGLAGAFGAPPRYGGHIEEAVLETAQMTEEGRAVVVVTRQAPRFSELLGQAGIHVQPTSELPSAPGTSGLAVIHGAMAAGWTLNSESQQTVLLTDGELFGWRMPRRRRPARAVETASPADYFSEYTPEDYVVHIEHGIGLFRGIQRMQVGGIERDYLTIEYAQGDMLYVPTHQADRVSRYVGAGDVTPAVSRLGTADWERAKKRAKREVEDIARELLTLYARREIAQRSAFASDTAWQADMEAAFPYLETDDQLQAIEEVKRDMESRRPMDRLVVGDVGFGKTEVAVRAAFKAVMAGRQVAVLAPTTVLVQQHFETFAERMGPFPVRVEFLSRFRPRREQREVHDRLAEGDVDIVIGTHRLLSSDVRFKDLGLLIVDEEHRFGVKHKEQLRELRQDVDTLTMTATPIPRTMHMALSGLRDLTTIRTPPEERLPVVTHVGPYDDGIIRQAVRREISRQGQVFYVFNRVMGIGVAAKRLGKLVPEATIAVAHGQMKEDELAQSMLNFVAGISDILVCTSIIESGLDIPNANTLIVERADRFGLAQLHQLRGRVGRSAQRAYAYFLYPQGHSLPPDAEARLDALAESADLGAGFRIAMRDLEIRGAGEILGARQHGQVAAIGLDLYTRLLAQAIKKLQADRPTSSEKVQEELAEIDPGTLPTVDLPLDAFLPEEYVGETAERTRLYRRMAAADDLVEVDEIERELVDRFGSPPEEVANLLQVLRLRVLAHLAGAENVGREGQMVAVRWGDSHSLDRTSLKLRLGRQVRIGRHQISISISGPPQRWLVDLRSTLEEAARIEGPRCRST